MGGTNGKGTFRGFSETGLRKGKEGRRRRTDGVRKGYTKRYLTTQRTEILDTHLFETKGLGENAEENTGVD